MVAEPRDDLIEQLRLAGCVYAEDEAEMVFESLRLKGMTPAGEDGAALMRDYVERRRAGEPAEYVLGWAQLGGIRVAVGPGVFIPRQWSERLVLRAVALLDGVSDGIAVDVGTGSGAIALAIHALAPSCRIWAIEADPGAAEWADLNCAGVDGITVCTGDLYQALPPDLEHRLDVIAGSLPYVPTPELDNLPRDHVVNEPLVAFDGGIGGLMSVTSAIAGAERWLRPGDTSSSRSASARARRRPQSRSMRV